MKTFNFLKRKYGSELLMDIGSYKDIPNYFFENELHNTDFYEIIFFTKGNGYLELDHQKIKITDNLIIFISPFQRRKWLVAKQKIDCHFLFFQDEFLSNFFSDKLFCYRLQYFHNKKNFLFINVDIDFLFQLHLLFKELLSELKQFSSDSTHITRSLLYYILIKLNRVYANYYELSSETLNNTIAFKFKKLLQKEISNNKNIEFYAKKIGVSRITLNKCIKNQFGVNVSEMIIEFMLFEIKSYLSYSDLTINEISNLLNFSEPNHLTRFFKKNTGFSPIQYRNTYQNGSSFI